MDKPEALRLADELDDIHTTHVARNAAAELRRLHKENELLASAADKLRMVWRDDVHCLMQDKRQLIAQRNALLEALIRCRDRFFPADQPERDRDELWEPVNAAIKAVEGETK